MNSKHLEFIEMLEGSGFKTGIAYQKVYGGKIHDAVNAACRLLKNPEIRKAIIQLIDSLPEKTEAAKILYRRVCEKELLTDFYAS
jgi:hypothetical protein